MKYLYVSLIILVLVLSVVLIFIFKDNNGGIPENSILVDESYVSTSENADYLIYVPTLCQYPLLPTGCESTSAAMVLQYFGEDITPEHFASHWLECNSDFYTCDGIDYGPDPNSVFAGDPFSKYSYGCYAMPIAKAINRNSDKCYAVAIQGKSLSELCEEYIDKGSPVLVWATMDMMPSYEGKSWQTPHGNKFTWIAQEHCLVLVGYNDDFYFFNDPRTGTTVSYERSLSQQRYTELGSRSVVVFRK